MKFEHVARSELLELRAAGFILAAFACDERHAACLRPLGGDIVLIALVRETDEAITATAWVAPIHFPDDGLDRLGVGYNLLLARSDFVTDIWSVIRRRLIDLAASSSLLDLVRREMADPPEITNRWQRYVAERRFWSEVLAVAESDRDVATSLSEMTTAVRREDAEAYENASLRLARTLRHANLSVASRTFLDDFDEDGVAAAMIGYVGYPELLIRTFAPTAAGAIRTNANTR